MILKTAVQTAHELIQQIVKEGDMVVDATAGNGKDTCFLARCVGETGHVYAFDIQQEAVNKTAQLLENEGVAKRVSVIHDSHHNLDPYLKEGTPIQLGLFNLGYLPGGDKSIVTRASTTIQAAEALIERLTPHGLVVLVVYSGHEEGQLEAIEIEQWARSLDQKQVTVQKIEMLNQANRPPYLVAIEKRGN